MAKTKGKSPTARTLDLLREWGWICQVVEHRQQSWADHAVRIAAKQVVSIYRDRGATKDQRHEAMRKLASCCDTFVPGRTLDLFNFIDIVGLRWNPELKKYDRIVGIQTTASSGRGARILKIKTECIDEAVAWLDSGGFIEVWGWYQYETKERILDPFGEPTELEGRLAGKRAWRPNIAHITHDDFVLEEPPF